MNDEILSEILLKKRHVYITTTDGEIRGEYYFNDELNLIKDLQDKEKDFVTVRLFYGDKAINRCFSKKEIRYFTSQEVEEKNENDKE